MKTASFIFLLLPLLSIYPSTAEIRFSKHKINGNSITPIDEFGFSSNGSLELNVSHIETNAKPDQNLSQLGFFLTTREAWTAAAQRNEPLCALQIPTFDIVLTFDNLNETSFSVTHRVKKPGLYTLLFANCMASVKISMHVTSAMYNIDPDTENRDYLPVGEAILPLLYLLFFLLYLVLSGIWIFVLYRKRNTAFRIHYFMLAVVILKAVNLICKAEDKSFIRRTGSAHGWDVLFYLFSFLKGIMFFTLIVLIGTGWSFLKPYLQDKEKRVLMAVIPLQIIANFAQIILDEGPYSSSDFITWKQIFMLVDVICCCAVLFPIVWSIKKLREAARTDGKAAVNLMKLTLFRQYYIIVICYIYFTRIGVYALTLVVAYRFLWTTEVAKEVGTLAFFVFTGYNFRPEVHNPYFAVEDDEEEGEVLRLVDEFEL